MSDNDEIIALFNDLQAAQRKLLEAQRRRGGQVMAQPYSFAVPDGRRLTLAGLFGDRRDLLVVHNMGEACNYCMMWADGLSSSTAHLASRAALWLTNNDPVEQVAAFRDSRGWAFPVASCRGTTFTTDCGFGKEGAWWPGVSAFHKADDGTITRVASSFFGPGDVFNPVWHLFDLLKDGANGWAPKRSYAAAT